MANGRYFLDYLMERMEKDRGDADNKGIQNCTRYRKIPIHLSYFSTQGNAYPQICVFINEGMSETVFPAGHYKLRITTWIKKEEKQRYKTMKVITDAINRLVNRKASSLSDIDVTENEGLRVARCVKDGGDIIFSKQTGMYFSDIVYDMVISEDESFAEADAGNKDWV